MDELRNVDVVEAVALLTAGALLLDVREIEEFESGRAPAALHIPLSELPDRLAALSKNQLIICACRSGGRSSRAGQFLLEEGFDAVNLEGGMLAWASGGESLIANHGEPFIH